MTTQFAVNDVCCVALELSKSTWVCAFAPPESGRASVHRMRAGDVDRLISVLEAGRARAMRDRSRSLEIVLCYEVGYDGFWLARLLIARGIRTIVFDPASFLKPRRGRPAKTDRLDAEEMTRILRTWLSGDRAVATAVRIPTVEEEDAKRIERERKNLVEERTSHCWTDALGPTELQFGSSHPLLHQCKQRCLHCVRESGSTNRAQGGRYRTVTLLPFTDLLILRL